IAGDCTCWATIDCAWRSARASTVVDWVTLLFGFGSGTLPVAVTVAVALNCVPSGTDGETVPRASKMRSPPAGIPASVPKHVIVRLAAVIVDDPEHETPGVIVSS